MVTMPKTINFKFHIHHQFFAKDDKEKIGYIESCIKVVKDANGRIVGALTGDAEWKNPRTNKIEKALDHHPLDPFGTTITLNDGYFLKVKEVDRLSGKDVDETNTQILSELTHSGRPPLLLKFNTLPNATKGDHEIFLTLFYSVDSDLKMDQKIVRIHINSWIEKHQKKLQWIAVILGLSALVAGIVQAVFTILQFYK